MQIPSIEDVAAVLALAPADQPWRHEGPIRHVVRQALCRAGWKWWAADRRAFVLVARARIRIGVRQPGGWDVNTWPGAWPSCWICDKPFSPKKPFGAYCSAVCHWRAARIRENPTRLKHCAKCNDVFEASYKSSRHQEYCSRGCQRAVEMVRDRESGASAARNARYRQSDAYRATQERRNAAKREKRRLAKLNGHATNGHADHAPETNGHASDDRPGPAGDAPGVGADQVAVDDRRDRVSGADAAPTAG